MLLENPCGDVFWTEGATYPRALEGTELQYTYEVGMRPEPSSQDEHYFRPAFLLSGLEHSQGTNARLCALAMHRTSAGGTHFATTLHSILNAFLSDRASVLSLSVPPATYAI